MTCQIPHYVAIPDAPERSRFGSDGIAVEHKLNLSELLRANIG
jgi:3-oxoacyl-ACP reductase-like protein